jgi:hypothetical protein
MTSIDSDYQLSQLHYERQVELIDAIKYHQLQKPFYELERKGVRTEILEELMMSPEFEELSPRTRRADQHHREVGSG